MKKFLVFLAVVVVLGAAGVYFMTSMPGSQGRGALPVLSDEEERASARLRDCVFTLARDIGVRPVSSVVKLNTAGQEVEAALRQTRLEVKLESVTGSGKLATIYIVDVKGTTKASEIVLVGSHYDSPRSSPGADCNASGTAVALELARRFANRPCERTVRFAFFSMSESPFSATNAQGAHQYALRCVERKDNIVAAVVLEGLGTFSDAPDSQSVPFPLNTVFPDTANFVAFVGDFRARDLVRRCVSEFRSAGRIPAYGCLLPGLVPGFHGTNAMALAREGITSVLVTDTGTLRSDSYADVADTPDRLDYARMARACGGLQRVIEGLATSARGSP